MPAASGAAVPSPGPSAFTAILQLDRLRGREEEHFLGASVGAAREDVLYTQNQQPFCPHHELEYYIGDPPRAGALAVQVRRDNSTLYVLVFMYLRAEDRMVGHIFDSPPLGQQGAPAGHMVVT